MENHTDQFFPPLKSFLLSRLVPPTLFVVLLFYISGHRPPRCPCQDNSQNLDGSGRGNRINQNHEWFYFMGCWSQVLIRAIRHLEIGSATFLLPKCDRSIFYKLIDSQ